MAEEQDNTESQAVEVEEWRDVPGYEGLYRVSNAGRVISFGRRGRRDPAAGGRILVAHSNGGYPAVTLCREGRSRGQMVHRLVLLAFVGPPEPGQEACHYDGNRGNSRLENLRWDSHYENCRDAVRHRRERGPVADGNRVASAARVESMARARAQRFGKAAVSEMTEAELERRASTATTLKAKARWLRKIAARGCILTPKQQEIVALAYRSSTS